MKIFKLVLLTPALISGAFATESSLDQLMQKAVLGFRDVLTEQNKKITELTDKVSILEQQLQVRLQAMEQKVSDLEHKRSNFVSNMSKSTMPYMAPTVKSQVSEPVLDGKVPLMKQVKKVGRFKIYEQSKPRNPDTKSPVSSSSSNHSDTSDKKYDDDDLLKF